jgi:hypothetical protein
MASTSGLDRLYTQLTALTGIKRIRDVRLEKIAADRALELRRGLGLSAEPGEEISHDPDQLAARVWPWQPTPRVTENAAWHYFPPSWVDPIDAAVDYTFPDDPIYGQYAGKSIGWWNSPIHKQQLENSAYTTWGHGIYFEDIPGASRRWYFITVFASDMEALELAGIGLLAGKHLGFHLSADGKVIHKVTRNFSAYQSATVDDRMHVPGKGPMLHLVGKPMNTYWIADDEEFVQWL